MHLFEVRKRYSFGKPEALILAAYSAVLGAVVARHEPWVDEAQAWLIARDCSLKEMFLHRLHYEGTPGLWHLFLWILARSHVSYMGMHWATAFVAVASIYLFLRYSPFPLIFRAVLPFTFFLQFQFAVVARSYVLFVLCIFLLASLFNLERPRPFLFALIAGLLANSSLFGAAAAIGFFLIYLWAPARKRLLETAPKIAPRQKIYATVLFSFLLLFAFYTAVPSPDASFGPAAKLSGTSRVGRLLSRITFTNPSATPVPVIEPIVASPFTPEEYARHSSNSFHDYLWRALADSSNPSQPHSASTKLIARVNKILSLLTFPISTQNWLAMAFVLSFALWLARRKQLYAAVPYLFLFLFCWRVSCEPHNAGLLWIAILTAIWIALSVSNATTPGWIEQSSMLLFLAISLIQVSWTIKAVHRDLTGNYDGSKAAANYIQNLPPGTTIAAFLPTSSAVEPYFSKNIFHNQSASFWLWSKTEDPDSQFEQTMRTHPNLVLLPENRLGGDGIMNQWIEMDPAGSLQTDAVSSRDLAAYGYVQVARFCGSTFMRSTAERDICYQIFVPSAAK